MNWTGGRGTAGMPTCGTETMGTAPGSPTTPTTPGPGPVAVPVSVATAPLGVVMYTSETVEPCRIVPAVKPVHTACEGAVVIAWQGNPPLSAGLFVEKKMR